MFIHVYAVDIVFSPLLMMIFKISKFVARYDLEPIYSADSSEKLHYIIDIYQRENCFFPIIRRRDHFCIYPTKINELCEEELLIYDITEEWETLEGVTEEEVLKKIMSKLEQLFNVMGSSLAFC